MTPLERLERLELVRDRVVDDSADPPARTTLTCRRCKRRGLGRSDRVVYSGRTRLFESSPRGIPERQYEVRCETCTRTFWTLARPA